MYIITPYLILDDGMKNAMAYAAKRGIDVKIIMPHIPDKVCLSPGKDVLSGTDRFRSEDLRV